MKIIKLTMLDFNHSIGFTNIKSSKKAKNTEINKTPRNSIKAENHQNILLVGVSLILFIIGTEMVYKIITDYNNEKDFNIRKMGKG